MLAEGSSMEGELVDDVAEKMTIVKPKPSGKQEAGQPEGQATCRSPNVWVQMHLGLQT